MELMKALEILAKNGVSNMQIEPSSDFIVDTYAASHPSIMRGHSAIQATIYPHVAVFIAGVLERAAAEAATESANPALREIREKYNVLFELARVK